jgi:hypothetical protein
MHALLLFATTLLFQTPAAKAFVDNARVTVWEDRAPASSFPHGAISVSSTGAVRYYPKNSPVITEKLIVGLKPATVAPLPNASGFPLAMPRPGAEKLLDNMYITVWNYRWTPGVPTPMHFHDKDVVVMFLEDGDLRSTTPSGEMTVNQYKPGTIRFNPRDRVHTEELIRGTQRAIIIELK